jgi:hypothetical protein
MVEGLDAERIAQLGSRGDAQLRVPKRVVNYSYDQSQILPALDQMAIAH